MKPFVHFLTCLYDQPSNLFSFCTTQTFKKEILLEKDSINEEEDANYKEEITVTRTRTGSCRGSRTRPGPGTVRDSVY